MKLLIISNMSHYLSDGCIVGWGPTVQEINHLASLFDEVNHIGCLHLESPPASSLPYDSPKIHFVPVPPAGGKRFLDKVGIVYRIPQYIRAIRKQMKSADVIHVRCPANISMVALLLLAVTKNTARRWIKYAGNWKPQQHEPWSYRFQRWFLARGFHRGVVTVNGNWENEPEFVYSFPNPCLTSEELRNAKSISLEKKVDEPFRIVFAGRVVEAKGVGRCLKVLEILKNRNLPAFLDVIGDGPERQKFENMAVKLGIASSVKFHGWLPRPEIPNIFSKAHIALFPSTSSEGWPKVLSEAMAYGAVPVASNISSIPYYLKSFDCGVALDPNDLDGFASAIASYRNNPEKWREESLKGTRAGQFFSYENYLSKVAEVLKIDRQKRIVLNEVAVN